MPRYAAVDIGSNSVRMLAAETSPGAPTKILAAERQVTRLGASVFQSGRIAREAMDFVTEELARMAPDLPQAGRLAVRAVATSAVRDASNQSEFLERASEALGTPVEIISGLEEARLIHLGVQSRWPQTEKRVSDHRCRRRQRGVDPRATAARWRRRSRSRWAPCGSPKSFLKSDPPAPIELHRMNEYIEEKLATPLRRIGTGPFDRVIATSASAAALVCAVNRVARARREEADRLKASLAQVRKFYRQVSALDLAGAPQDPRRRAAARRIDRGRSRGISPDAGAVPDVQRCTIRRPESGTASSPTWPRAAWAAN